MALVFGIRGAEGHIENAEIVPHPDEKYTVTMLKSSRLQNNQN